MCLDSTDAIASRKRQIRLSPRAALIALIAVRLTATVVAQSPAEEAVKAAFLSRFPQFVQWPPQVWDGRRTVEICVLQPMPFGQALYELTADAMLGDRPLTVREVTSTAAVDSCHVLFVTAGQSEHASSLLRRARTLPILTVSDAPDFLDEGGIIQLRTVGTRVRFDIDAVTAGRVGLRLSAQLLRLASTVRGGPE
jgi:hypothetical protein